MSVKTDYLLSVLEKNDCRHLKGSLPLVTEKDIRKAGLYDEAQETYVELGGKGSFPVDPAPYAIELENAAIILDDDLHFNRYRAITLRSQVYQKIKTVQVDNYKRFCRQFESECIKAGIAGDRWTNQRSESFFGLSQQERGDLSGNGSAEWKYKAFRDYLTDLANVIFKHKVIRISIYDNLMVNNQLIQFNKLLLSRKEENEKYVFNYLQRRLSN
ncbi:MAG TPA: hypothetical protein VIK89_03590 [Cytophagaceae bacterium]